MDIARKLMTHMEKAEGTHYRDELLAKIIEICNQGDYQHITNFEWFVYRRYSHSLPSIRAISQ